MFAALCEDLRHHLSPATAPVQDTEIDSRAMEGAFGSVSEYSCFIFVLGSDWGCDEVLSVLSTEHLGQTSTCSILDSCCVGICRCHWPAGGEGVTTAGTPLLRNATGEENSGSQSLRGPCCS